MPATELARISPLTLDQFNELFPAPDFMLEKPDRLLSYLWHYDLNVTAADLWPYVTDTSRMNRSVGFPEMSFEEREGRLYGSSLWNELPHEWLEVPWDFTFPYTMVCVRRYTQGFVNLYRAIYFAEDYFAERACRVYVFTSWVVRMARMKAKFNEYFETKRADYGKAFGELESRLLARESDPRVRNPAPQTLEPGVRERVEILRKQIIERGQTHNLPGETLTKVTALWVEHLLEGDEMDLYRMQVVPLATRWKVPVRDALRVALLAVEQGLLTMSWDVICPHCRGVREEVPSLGKIPLRGFCDVCLIDFDNTANTSLEITFHVHPSVRKVKKRMYCSAEPATRPHIKLQQTLRADESRAVLPVLYRGQYRTRQIGVDGMAWLDVEDEAQDFRLEWKSSDALKYRQTAPQPELLLTNDHKESRTFIVEDVRWGAEALRPADLFNLQDFRNLFPTETLAPDFYLEVGEQTIVFTDVVNSTGFYMDLGDGEAFTAVRRHFAALYDIADRHDGAVVKTIGDSAMMAFSEPRAAFRATRAIAQLFGPDAEGIRLRQSCHTGPCIAVRLNSGIDYFGQTVNFAAKILRTADAGQVAISGASLALLGEETAGLALKQTDVLVGGRSFQVAVATRQ